MRWLWKLIRLKTVITTNKNYYFANPHTQGKIKAHKVKRYQTHPHFQNKKRLSSEDLPQILIFKADRKENTWTRNTERMVSEKGREHKKEGTHLIQTTGTNKNNSCQVSQWPTIQTAPYTVSCTRDTKWPQLDFSPYIISCTAHWEWR